MDVAAPHQRNGRNGPVWALAAVLLGSGGVGGVMLQQLDARLHRLEAAMTRLSSELATVRAVAAASDSRLTYIQGRLDAIIDTRKR